MRTTGTILDAHRIAALALHSLTPHQRARLVGYAEHKIGTRRPRTDTVLEDAGLIDVTGEPTVYGWLAYDYRDDNPNGAGWTVPRGSLLDANVKVRRTEMMLAQGRAVRLGRWAAIPVQFERGFISPPRWWVRRCPSDNAADWRDAPATALAAWDGGTESFDDAHDVAFFICARADGEA